MDFKATAIWAGRAAMSGLVSFATPKMLVGMGVPLDRWFTKAGAYIGLHYSPETALWGVTAVIFAALLYFTRNWGVRNIHHKELTVPVSTAVSLDKVVTRAPQRDATLAEGLAYAEFGDWGRTFFDAAAKAANHANEQLERFRQLAHDGTVTVWGKRRENGIFETIPRDHWTDHNIEWFDLLRGNARTENVMHTTPNPFLEIMVSRTQFEKEWPHA